MPSQKGVSMRWQYHDKMGPELLSTSIALQLAMPHDDPTVIIHPGYVAPLEYTNAMIKKHRQGVIMALIDKIGIICILAKHCPKRRPMTTDMHDTMFHVLSNATAKRILSKSRLNMAMGTAKLFGSSMMFMLYVVRALCNNRGETSTT